MYAKSLLIAITVSALASSTFAADAGADYEAAKQQAASHYASEKNLCEKESSASQRAKCLRHAKADYSKSLASAKEANEKNLAALAKPAAPVAAAICDECGKVISVKVVEKEGESSPLGIIAGGVAGAVLGHQVGDGRGKKLATIAGAAGGAYAGHKIEQNMRSSKSWVVGVRFENGHEREFNFSADPGLVSGDAVKASGNSLVKR